MVAEDVTEEMLLRAGLVAKGALKAKNNEKDERRRQEALEIARRRFIEQRGKSVSDISELPEDLRRQLDDYFEAVHGKRPENVDYILGGVDGLRGYTWLMEINIMGWEASAREAAMLKGTLQELLKNEANAGRRRQIRIKLATPKWVDFGAIAELVAERRRVTEITGVEHHIDHIVPLAGKHVCGLHWHGNMKVVSATVNLRKSRKFAPGLDG